MTRRVLMIIREPREEIMNPTFGGSRLIRELYKQLTAKGTRVIILSVHDLNTPSAYMLRIRSNGIATLGASFLKLNKLKWLLNLLYSLLTETISRIDIVLQKKIIKKIDVIKPDIILYNGPIGAFTFLSVSRQKSIPFVLVEHNVDYYFYKDKLGDNFLINVLINIYRIIELMICKATDLIICFNPYDKDKLVSNGIPSKKIFIWKFNIKGEECYNKELAINKIPPNLRHRIKDNFVIGFLGSNYILNVIAAKFILQIAKKLPKDITFLIIGSVAEAFREFDFPPNVVFTGRVRDIKPYLAIADVLLNIKLTSNTGIEAKMFDYVACSKPVISTKIGAIGFEHFSNVIIVDNIRDVVHEIIKLYKKFYINNKKIRNKKSHQLTNH